MKFILLIFSFVAKHLIFKNDVKSNAPNKYNEFEGCDQRYVLSKSFTNVTDSSRSPPNDTQIAFGKNETVTSTDVFKFNKFFYQKDLLIYLQNPNASIINKLALLDKYDGEFNTVSKFATNLVAGGLFTSWDMDMDMDMEFDLNKKKT